uniref:Uncharacterized protein n=1 Tax=Timema tahoe TaxID=61484 RepID=A0A7R9ISA6_9NEOP|nr:unnamed protein product [Timema tahoe]
MGFHSSSTQMQEIHPHLREARVENQFVKTTLSSPDQDLNPNLPVTGSLVYHKSSALDHAATEAGRESIVIVNKIELKILMDLDVSWTSPLNPKEHNGTSHAEDYTQCTRLGFEPQPLRQRQQSAMKSTHQLLCVNSETSAANETSWRTEDAPSEGWDEGDPDCRTLGTNSYTLRLTFVLQLHSRSSWSPSRFHLAFYDVTQ